MKNDDYDDDEKARGESRLAAGDLYQTLIFRLQERPIRIAWAVRILNASVSRDNRHDKGL